MTVAPLARILVVDDEAASARALCDTLPQYGYEAIGFGSGKQALAALQQQHAFDIVLTDLMMPGMDGVELLSRCLEIDAHLVGIVMTGAGTIETAVQAMKAGAVDYVLKPIRMPVLLPVLSRAASIRRLRLENLELRSTVGMHELTQAMAHTLDPGVLLDRIADAAMAQFDADETSVMLLDDSGETLQIAAVRGKGREDLLGQRIPLASGIAGWVAAQREPVVLQGAVADPRFASMHPRPEIQSALCMPMITRNELIGVLAVNCLDRRNAFSPGQVKVLSIFTNAAAAGIEAARLYEAQRRSDARYREILQMAADAIISVNAQRQIVVFNTGAEAIFGYGQQEVLGKPLDMLLPADLVQPYLADGQPGGAGTAPAPQAASRRALWARRKDGTGIRVEAGISSRRENGTVLCTAVVRDISERVRGERRIADLTRIKTVLSRIGSAIVRIRNRDELFREACRIAVEDGGAGIAWIGTIDAEEDRVVPVASAGLDPDSTAARDPVSLDAAPGQAGRIVEQAVLERRMVFCNDLSQLSAAGTPRRQEALRRGLRSVAVLPLVVRDRVIGVLSLFLSSLEHMGEEGAKLYGQLATDISFGLEHIANMEELQAAKQALEQERAQLAERVAERTAALTRSNRELVRAREEADQANRAKSAFLAAMSHEIRTPMNGVLGMLEVLAHEPLTEQQRDMVRTVRESATSLLGIIDDILDFSKIEAGRLEIELAPVRLGDLVEAICTSMLPVAWNSGIDLRLFVAPDVPPVVRSDEVRLRQLLFNLLGNAIKFSRGTGRRGRVSVLVTVHDRSPLRIRLRVEDNGIGMDADTLARVFQPFTQGEASTTRRFGGTGLGLAICKRVATRMGGDIGVRSVLGRGSVFDIVLPFEAEVEDAADAPPDLSGLHCTVVTSADLDAEDLRAYLEHAGAEVTLVAADAEPSPQPARDEQSVIIRDAGRDSTSPVDGGAFAATTMQPRPRARQRRRLRVEGRETVTLDRDALRRQLFLQSVARAAGRCAPEGPGAVDAPALIAGGTAPLPVEQARALGRLILVVEDDAVNQKVVMQQLALLGHSAQVASDGHEALRMWRTGGYGLLLTDLHMPGMDGYALAEAIRRDEPGRERVPIIALTANALRGEAHRALSSGMDAYLTKPVELKALRETLDCWLSGADSAAAGVAVAEVPHAGRATTFDVSVLERLVGNDPRVVRELLLDFRRSCAQHAAALRSAYSNGDGPAVAAAAHKLKSSSRSAGALDLGELCAALEAAGKAGDRARMGALMSEFDAIYPATDERISRALLAAS